MTRVFRKLLLTITALSAFAALSFGLSTISAKAEITECTELVSLPAIITVQGIYCFKGNLVTSIASGNAITINTNNVTIDMNGFKLGGSTAGAATLTNGIYAIDRKNITIRNGSIRGFYEGIYLAGTNGTGHLIEGVRIDGIKAYGIDVVGSNNIIRNNHVINTGSGTVDTNAYGIYVGSANSTLVADNVVSSVSETGNAYGIYIALSNRVEVRGNSIYEIKDATSKYGIWFVNSSDLTILQNRLINTSTTGTTGIFELSGSSTVGCISNVTVGYSTATSGCDFTLDNVDY